MRRHTSRTREHVTFALFQASSYYQGGTEVYWLRIRYNHEMARVARLPKHTPYRQERLDAYREVDRQLCDLLEHLEGRPAFDDDIASFLTQTIKTLEELARPGYVPPHYYAPGAAGVAKLRELRAGCKVYFHAARDVREVLDRNGYPDWLTSEFRLRTYARNGRLLHPPVPVRPRTVAKQLAARKRAGKSAAGYSGRFLET